MACPRAGGPFRGRRRRRNDRTSARGQGAGQIGGGHADAESGTNTPMLLARSRGPDDHLGKCADLGAPAVSGSVGSPLFLGCSVTEAVWQPLPCGRRLAPRPSGWTGSASGRGGERRRTQQPPPVIAVGFYGAWTRYPKRPRMYFTRSGDEERGHFDSLHRAGRRLMLCWFGQRPPDSSAFGKGCVWLASSSEMVAPRAAASSSSVGTASRTDGGRAS